jgi:hypothetical protein
MSRKKFIEEASKFADDDLAKRWNAKFLKGYDDDPS